MAARKLKMWGKAVIAKKITKCKDIAYYECKNVALQNKEIL